MTLALTLMNRLVSMMLIVVIGYVAVKVGVLRDEDSRPLSSLTVYVLTPCLILNAYQIELTEEGCSYTGACRHKKSIKK